MSWITLIWSMLISASLTFALLHLFLWAKGIKPGANLSFAVTALAAAVITGFEFMVMRASSLEQMTTVLRWVHLPILVLWLGIFYFVRSYFQAGRLWLAWTGGSLRLLALILSFTTGQNLFFKEMTGLKQVTLWDGETISIAKGILNPWYVIAPLSTIILAAFVLDATVTLCRRETAMRRRALFFSGSIIFFLLASFVHAALVNTDVIESPYLVGLSFMPILLAMSYDLSCDMLNSMQIAQQLEVSEAELRTNKQRMTLAASAADLRLWEWDIVRDEIWSTDKNPNLFGLAEPQKVNFESFLSFLYEEDRQNVRLAIEKAMTEGGQFESEYRIVMRDGQVHWFNSRGRVEFSDQHRPLRMLGVTMDISRRKQAELEVQRKRNEMMHLSRVNLLGELSGSLAHELNQPLTAILSNAQAAQRFLARDKADLDEIKSILDDIIAEDRRAGDIIQRLRQLLKKGEVQQEPLNLNMLVDDVLKLVKSDLTHHNITVKVDLEKELPSVLGDRVQIQQVMLNLFINACEAMSQISKNKCRLLVRTEQPAADKVMVSVVDQGPGIPSDCMERIFEPFFTTKSHGMGLGLPICRTIITAHGGQLWAVNNTPGGTVFHFTLPIYQGKAHE
ncbi:MAG: ATP-binding protein [Gammaproteobacteria bacterium]